MCLPKLHSRHIFESEQRFRSANNDTFPLQIPLAMLSTAIPQHRGQSCMSKRIAASTEKQFFEGQYHC